MVRSTLQTLGVLAERGWLASQPAAFRDRIAAVGHWRMLSRHQPLYFADDMPDALYGLAEGALTLSLPLVGEEQVTFYRTERGFWIGESALLADSTRTMSVHAASEARVFRVGSDAIRTLLAREPKWWPCFYALSHRNATLAITILAEVLSLTPRARLARTLLRLAGPGAEVVATQAELAELIGMTRSSLQRALSSLIEAGAIRQEFARILLVNPAMLADLSKEA